MSRPERIEVVEVYWRPSCPFCGPLRRGLARTGIPTRETNIWAEPAGAARVRAVAGGNETVPTVFIGARALVAPRLRDVLSAVADLAPELLPAERDAAGRRGLVGWLRRGLPRGH